MKRPGILSFCLFFFAFFPFFTPLSAQQAGKQVPVKIPATNAVDNALLYLPWDYDLSGKAYPLICFFHGMGEAGNGGADLGRLANQGLPNVIKNGKAPYSVNSKGDTTRFIVISIQAPATGYYSPTPEIMIAGISSLVNDYHLRIDANRIYTTGLSAGGRQSLWAVMNYPSTFTAGVIMSASSPIYSDKVDSFAHAYVWLFHGIYDPTASPYNSYGTNDLINAKYPGHSRLTKYDNGHCCWNQFYDPGWKEDGMSIYDFLLQYTRFREVTGSRPGNQEPKANAGGYQTIAVPSATLNASGSYDPDGSISSYRWSQASGPAQATFSSTAVSTPTVSNLQAGVYVFDLTVTDNNGATATGRTQVTVKAPAVNKPPKAIVGDNQTVTLPHDILKLDASGSYAQDGGILSYQWVQVSGPSQAVFSSTSAITPAIGNLKAGTYIFDLIVTDNTGATATERTQVTVKAAAPNNVLPKAAAGGYQTITATSATLNGSGSYDPDGSIASYQWTQFTGPAKAAFSSAASATPTVSNLQAGVYVFDLTVTDNNGATATGRTQVTVKAAANNLLPKAAAGGYQTITTTSATLNASGSYDPDGSIASYQWTQFAGPAKAAFSSTAGATPTVSNLQAGVYVFDLTVTDNDGATATGRTQVTVKAAINNISPKANAGGYQAITPPATSATLNASGSYDPDGSIASYQWTQFAGPAKAAFSSTAGTTPTVSNLLPGVYVFDLTVTDNNGATATGRTQVTVFQPNLSAIGISGLRTMEPAALSGRAVNSTGSPVQAQATAPVITPDPPQSPGIPDILRIYPNPVHDILYVKRNKKLSGKIVLQLVNIHGQVVRSFDYPEAEGSGSREFNLSGIPPGLYIIQLLQNKRSIESQKIIKY